MNLRWLSNERSVEAVHGEDVLVLGAQNAARGHVQRAQQSLFKNSQPLGAIGALHSKG